MAMLKTWCKKKATAFNFLINCSNKNDFSNFGYFKFSNSVIYPSEKSVHKEGKKNSKKPMILNNKIHHYI